MNYSIGIVRLCFFLAVLFYSFGLIFSHSTYLIWQDYVPFFNYERVTVGEFFVLIFFVVLVTIVMPLRVRNVSDIFVWVLLLFLYIPIYVIYMGSNDALSISDIAVYFVVAFSFLLIALPSFSMRKEVVSSKCLSSLTGERLKMFFLFLWFVLFFVIIQKYFSVISFRGLGHVYVQRELGRADSLFHGYIQVYFGYVISVGLVGLGLYYKNKLHLLIGVFGCLVLYSVTAERTIFLLPFFVYFVYSLIVSKRETFWLIILVFLAGFYFFLIGLFGDLNKLTKDLGFYFLTRIVAIPGLFFVDYLGYFNEVGYTYFSHAKGFDLLFNASAALAQDPLYPELGRIVARDVHGINSNSNASFLSTDGVAGFGLFGVLIVSAMLSMILYLVNFLTKYWPLQLTAALFAPMALTLTNGSLFTVLLSFGMLFWMAIFLTSRVVVRIS